MKLRRMITKNPGRLAIYVMLSLMMLAFSGIFILLANDQPDVWVESENGIWDLRAYDLQQTDVQLSGEVEYIPEALLTPEQYTARAGEVRLLDQAFSEQYGTSRIRLLLPDDGWYTLTRISIDYATRLYANGELVAEVGSPGDSAETTVSNLSRITFTAQAVHGELELVQQSANFVHRSGGYHGGWQIGGTRLAQKAQAADFAIMLEMGAYCSLFFIHMLLFFLLPSYRPNLYFALFCLTWFLRMGTTGHSVFSTLLPWMDWNLKFRIEYCTVSAIVALLSAILRALFPDIVPRAIVYFSYGVNAVFLLFCVVLTTMQLSQVAPFFLMLCVISAAYCFIQFGIKLRRVRIDQGIFLFGIALVACVSVRDIFAYARFVLHQTHRYTEMTQVGVLACSFFAATAFFIATMRMVSEAKDAEQRLAIKNDALNQINRMKSDLMANISHELKTPLTVMSGYAQLTLRQIKADRIHDETQENLRTISREAQRLAELADGLLRTTTDAAATWQHKALEISVLFARTGAICRPILAKNGNSLEIRLADEPLSMWGDADMLQQVLLNLVFNANRHTLNGTVVVWGRPAAEKPEFVEVLVMDNGDGISPELLPYVFERNTSAGDSSGIGLAICKEIVEAHDGSISIDSVLGGGTRVSVTLPRSGEEVLS